MGGGPSQLPLRGLALWPHNWPRQLAPSWATLGVLGRGHTGASTFLLTPSSSCRGRRWGARPPAGRRLPLQQRRRPPGHPQVGCPPAVPPLRVTPMPAAPSLRGRCPRPHFMLTLSPLHTMSVMRSQCAWRVMVAPMVGCRERKINESIDNGFNVFKLKYLMDANILLKARVVFLKCLVQVCWAFTA